MAGQNHIRDMARSVLTVMLLAAATGITTAKPDPGIPIGSARSVGMSAERLVYVVSPYGTTSTKF